MYHYESTPETQESHDERVWGWVTDQGRRDDDAVEIDPDVLRGEAEEMACRHCGRYTIESVWDEEARTEWYDCGCQTNGEVMQ